MNISDTLQNLHKQGNKLGIDVRTLAESASNALPNGWYPVEVLEGYQSRSGFDHVTTVVPSQNGESLNLRVCFKVTVKPGEFRMLNTQINYRLSDFSPEIAEIVQRLREEFRGQQGAWPEEFKKYQAASLTINKLGQLSEASGVELTTDDNGKILTGELIGKKFFGYVNINKEGYNDIGRFSAFASGVKPRGRASKKSAPTT